MELTAKARFKTRLAIILVTCLFFLWGFALNLNPILIPHLKKACQLSDFQSALIDSASYIAYFIFAIPAGRVMKRYGYKGGILFGLLLFAFGSFLFYPAAETRIFSFFLGALFIIASGLTFLETAANPYIMVLGDSPHAVARLNFAQSFNGLAATVAPLVGGIFILSGKLLTNEQEAMMSPEQLNKYLDLEAMSVESPFLIIGGVVLVVAILMWRTNLPEIEDAQRDKKDTQSLLQEKNLMLGVITQFFYVGAQVCVSSFFIRFAYQVGGVEEKAAAVLLSVALFGFMAGRFFGTFLMKFISPARILTFYTVVNFILLMAAVLLDGMFSVYALVVVEFFLSIMFPTIFALSIRNLGAKTKEGSSLVIMSIVGGAVFPAIMGKVSDLTSIQTAYLVPAACFSVVFYFGLKNIRAENITLTAISISFNVNVFRYNELIIDLISAKIKTSNMKNNKLLFLVLLLFCGSLLKAQERYEATWESLKKYQCPDWFKDAKFGIFIHWGVYSVPGFGSEWYPRLMYKQGSNEFKHHLEKYGTLDKFGYKDFIPLFKAEKFNADEWVSLFKKSGAKYVVPVAEHHDGFAMYKTALSRWNSLEMGPKRDIIGELAEATRKQGLIFGLSSHRIEHWFFMNGGRSFNSDVLNPAFHDLYGPAREENETPSPEYMNDWLLRNTELINNYQPQLFWFDWWIEQPAMDPYRKSFASYYYNKGLEWNKGVVINYKNIAFPEGTAVYDIERGSSKATKKLPWQTDTSIGKKSWGFIEGEENKTPNEIVDALVDIVSKNGNLLLNIGPRPDGTITEGQQAVLLDIGAWLGVNGEGIYGSRPWKISGEGPTENPEENVQFNEYKAKGYQVQDIRFTTKGEAVYVFVLDVPKVQVVIKSMGSSVGKIAKVELIGSSEKLTWSQSPDALRIDPLKVYPTQHAVTYRVSFLK